MCGVTFVTEGEFTMDGIDVVRFSCVFFDMYRFSSHDNCLRYIKFLFLKSWFASSMQFRRKSYLTFGPSAGAGFMLSNLFIKNSVYIST